jgi:hypothetical protein
MFLLFENLGKYISTKTSVRQLYIHTCEFSDVCHYLVIHLNGCTFYMCPIPACWYSKFTGSSEISCPWFCFQCPNSNFITKLVYLCLTLLCNSNYCPCMLCSKQVIICIIVLVYFEASYNLYNCPWILCSKQVITCMIVLVYFVQSKL